MSRPTNRETTPLPVLFAALLPSPVGHLLAVVDQAGALRRLEFLAGEPEASAALARVAAAERAEVRLDAARCAPVAAQLEEYFADRRRAFELTLAPRGTPFQQATWRALVAIPWGETVSYGELARRLGRPGAARAVGQANGANPLPIVVPCHRVLAGGGRLGGYGGGLDRKRRLLALEGVEAS